MTGFEPATSSSRTRRSTKLSHIPTGGGFYLRRWPGPAHTTGVRSSVRINLVHIQPYFPEPIEVSENIASRSYQETLRFTRTVIAGHAASVVAVIAGYFWLPGVLDLGASAAAFAVGLLALTLLRRFTNGGWLDNVGSLLLLIPTLGALSLVAQSVAALGAPVFVLAIGYLFLVLYACLCGRDFSFVGQYVLALGATILTVVVLAAMGRIGWLTVLNGSVLAAGFNFYFVYDLAAMMRRRRSGEQPAAVADLYRDQFNFITYAVRIVLHWRKFRFI